LWVPEFINIFLLLRSSSFFHASSTKWSNRLHTLNWKASLLYAATDIPRSILSWQCSNRVSVSFSPSSRIFGQNRFDFNIEFTFLVDSNLLAGSLAKDWLAKRRKERMGKGKGTKNGILNCRLESVDRTGWRARACFNNSLRERADEMTWRLETWHMIWPQDQRHEMWYDLETTTRYLAWSEDQNMIQCFRDESGKCQNRNGDCPNDNGQLLNGRNNRIFWVRLKS
jgi:hypothetical protein